MLEVPGRSQRAKGVNELSPKAPRKTLPHVLINTGPGPSVQNTLSFYCVNKPRILSEFEGKPYKSLLFLTHFGCYLHMLEVLSAALMI